MFMKRNRQVVLLGVLMLLVCGTRAGLAAEGPASLSSVPGARLITPEALDKAQTCPETGCEPEPSGFTCYDTDGGRLTTSPGTVTLYYYSSYVASYADYCSNYETLVEYWCTSTGGWSSTNYLCLNGCSGGKCLPG